MVQDKGKKAGALWGFPRGSVLRTWHFHSSGLGSIPGRGTKILQIAWCGQTLKKKEKKKLYILNLKPTKMD